MKMRMLLGAGAAGLLTASANAALYQWDWNVGDPGSYGVNNNGGTFESIHSEYDSVSKHFTWSVTFSDQVTKGFTLAVNNGPNPKNTPGQLAALCQRDEPGRCPPDRVRLQRPERQHILEGRRRHRCGRSDARPDPRPQRSGLDHQHRGLGRGR